MVINLCQGADEGGMPERGFARKKESILWPRQKADER